MSSKRITYQFSIDLDVEPVTLAEAIAETFEPDDVTAFVLKLDDLLEDLDWTKDLHTKLGQIIQDEES